MWHPRDALRAFALLLLIALLAWSRGTRPASAATAPVPGGCLLGFGVAYSAGGGTRTHLGADLGGSPGAEVEAPVAGKVVFAGQVPATDGSGGRALCVTIVSGSDRWTLLPLDAADVDAGQDVAEGTTVGRLAGSGDGSSSQTHLHVGLRRGGVYMDPVAQLSAAAVAGSSGGAAEAHPGDDSGDEGEPDRGRPEAEVPGADAAAAVPAGSARRVPRSTPCPAPSVRKGSAASVRTGGRADRTRVAARTDRGHVELRGDPPPPWSPEATAGAVRLAAVIALSACAAAALAAGAVSVRRSTLEERQEAVDARAGP